MSVGVPDANSSIGQKRPEWSTQSSINSSCKCNRKGKCWPEPGKPLRYFSIWSSVQPWDVWLYLGTAGSIAGVLPLWRTCHAKRLSAAFVFLRDRSFLTPRQSLPLLHPSGAESVCDPAIQAATHRRDGADLDVSLRKNQYAVLTAWRGSSQSLPVIVTELQFIVSLWI